MTKTEREIRNGVSIALVGIGTALTGCAPSASDVAKEVLKQIPPTPTAIDLDALVQRLQPTAVPPTRTPDYKATVEAKPTVAPAIAPTRVATRPATLTSVENGVPKFAKVVRPGDALIPDWGYGPWGQPELVYPKVGPEGNVPKGRSQLVTNFNGNNWVDDSTSCFRMPSGATETDVTIQGDAPAEVKWDKASNRLCFTSNADVSRRAPDAKDNAPHPTKGSSGISAVVSTK